MCRRESRGGWRLRRYLRLAKDEAKRRWAFARADITKGVSLPSSPTATISRWLRSA